MNVCVSLHTGAWEAWKSEVYAPRLLDWPAFEPGDPAVSAPPHTSATGIHLDSCLLVGMLRV